MRTRTINKELLKASIKEVGIAKVAVAADCSPSLLQKLLSDSYLTIPSVKIIDGICEATSHSMDELFPFVCDTKKESA